jgi:hypothetical protein
MRPNVEAEPWRTSSPEDPIEERINGWVNQTDAIVIDTDVRQFIMDEKLDTARGQWSRQVFTFYTLTWMPVEAYMREQIYLRSAAAALAADPMIMPQQQPAPEGTKVGPIATGSTLERAPSPELTVVPVISVKAQIDVPETAGKTVRKTINAMAGVFGVSEGQKMHPEDDEPAPKPLISPAFNFEPFQSLFVSIGA